MKIEKSLFIYYSLTMYWILFTKKTAFLYILILFPHYCIDYSTCIH